MCTCDTGMGAQQGRSTSVCGMGGGVERGTVLFEPGGLVGWVIMGGCAQPRPSLATATALEWSRGGEHAMSATRPAVNSSATSHDAHFKDGTGSKSCTGTVVHAMTPLREQTTVRTPPPHTTPPFPIRHAASITRQALYVDHTHSGLHQSQQRPVEATANSVRSHTCTWSWQCMGWWLWAAQGQCQAPHTRCWEARPLWHSRR